MDEMNLFWDELTRQAKNRGDRKEISNTLVHLKDKRPDVGTILFDFAKTFPQLKSVLPDLVKTYEVLVKCFAGGHTLFLCGNGGSFADCLHISGEMLKSYERNRSLSEEEKRKFDNLPFGAQLANSLERGFPVIVLGLNHSLVSALENDNPTRYLVFAQELYALAKAGDVLMGISTSGNARNVIYAVVTAKALDLMTVSLTGEKGGRLAELTDIAIKAPGEATRKVQENHLPIYHTLCAMVEARFFPDLMKSRWAELDAEKLVSRERLKEMVTRMKTAGKTIVWTNGCFDIMHAGHIFYLEKAKAIGDILVVGLNSDASIRAVKGPARPIVEETQRAKMLTSLSCVDYVVIFSEPTPLALIDELKPDYYVKGGDYTIDTINQQERRLVEGYGGKIVLLPGVEGISTTNLINKILKLNAKTS